MSLFLKVKSLYATTAAKILNTKLFRAAFLNTGHWKLNTVLDTGHRILATALLGSCLLLVGLATSTRLLESASESLEGVRYLLVLKSASLKRGDIVSIQDHTPQYVGAHLFSKRIVGLPGDQIIRDNAHPNHLTLKAQNGAHSLILPLLTQTKEGHPLTPLSVSVIPKDHFFVMGDHPRSFDSRYEEFGLISKDKIWGKGVFTW